MSGRGGFQEAVAVDQTQRLESQKLAVLEELKKSILHQAYSGEL